MILHTSPQTARLRQPRRQSFRLWPLIEVFRERKALAKLGADQLNDIGLTKNEAQREANRSIWDVPSHWRA